MASTESPSKINEADAVMINDMRIFFVYLPIPLAILGILLASTYAVAVIRLMWYHRVSRKCYAFLLDRTVSDVLACIAAVAGGIYFYAHSEGAVFITTEVLLFVSIWSAMVSYVSLSLVKLYAVVKPGSYRRVVSLRRCIYLIALSWTLYLMQIFALVAAIRTSDNDWAGCYDESCTNWFRILRHTLILVCYFLTIGTFTVTLIYVNRARQYLNQTRVAESDKVSHFSLWKIMLNVVSFALLYSIHAATSIFALFTDGDYLFGFDRFPIMWRLYLITRTMLLIRIIADPIISFFVDYQVRKSIIEIAESCLHRQVHINHNHSVFARLDDDERYADTSMTEVRHDVVNHDPRSVASASQGPGFRLVKL